jgi:hypothetical protein
MIGVHAPAEHYRSPIVRVGLRVFAVVLVLAAVGSAVSVTGSIRDARASMTWPSVTGRVSESAVEESTVGTKRSFTARVRYDYVVGGRGYTNRAIGFSDAGGSSRDSAEGVVARYPSGATVPVYYDPADPQNAVLERGASPRVYAMALIPLAMILVAVVVWRAQRANGRRRGSMEGNSR